ncbi:hypothetical protein BT69DRAFT_1350524 [Atractiella rhizophila]|nr:hypothetical protein BT69DRAFT_1350524 [Atractiella rhizophila]
MPPQGERRRPKPRARAAAVQDSGAIPIPASSASPVAQSKGKGRARDVSEEEDDFFTRKPRAKVPVRGKAKKKSSSPDAKLRGSGSSGSGSESEEEKPKRGTKRRRIEDLVKASKADVQAINVPFSLEDSDEEREAAIQEALNARELSITPPPPQPFGLVALDLPPILPQPIFHVRDDDEDERVGDTDVVLNPRLRDIQQRVALNRQLSGSAESASPVRARSKSATASAEEESEADEEEETVDIEVTMKMVIGRDLPEKRKFMLMYERPMTVTMARSERFETVFAQVALQKGVDKTELVLTDMEDRKVFDFSTPMHNNIFGKVKFKGYKLSDFEFEQHRRRDNFARPQARAPSVAEAEITPRKPPATKAQPILLDSSEGEMPAPSTSNFTSIAPHPSVASTNSSPSTVPTLRITLRGTSSKSGAHSLNVKKTMTVNQLLKHYLKLEQLPVEWLDRCSLSFDGDKLGKDDEIGDCDIEDEDLLDVVLPPR